MIWIFLFVFGLLVGSFLNVIALRYKEDEPVLGVRVVGGRSQCMTCQVGLKWYELVPLFSFLVQGAKCRHCKHSLNWQYPIVEFVTAILTVALPYFLYTFYGASVSTARGDSMMWFYIATSLWLLVTYTSIVLSAIDLRLRIIPDQCNALLGVLGIALLGFRYLYGGVSNFTGAYASILGSPDNIFISALIAIAFAVLLFGGTIYFTKGRGMGLGDLKLAIPLALLLGWPDVLIAFMASFIIGSAVGLLMIAGKRATMKAAVPFGPFIVIGMYVAIFYGESILRWYFSLV
jgi:leader peptidase (prepilin peptidase)/N-methyltransferase